MVGYRRRVFAWILLVRRCSPLADKDVFANAICRLKCDDFADAYLCNANGSFVDGNATFTKPKQHDRAHTLTWTLRDADAAGYDAKGWRISVMTDENLANATLSEREQTLVEKGNELLEKEQRFSAEQQTKDDELTARETKLRKTSDDLASKEAELRRISDDLTSRETAQQKQAEELATREAELSRIPHRTNKDIAILKAENDNLHLQLRTSSLEREVEKVRQRSVSLSNVEQLRNLEVEKARLRVLLHAQQQKARNSPSLNQSRDSPSVFSSPSSLATRTVKDARTTPARNTSRPVSSSGSVPRPANLSLAATPNSSLRYTDKDSPSTPTRASTGVLSSASSTQRSYDSRFSGWPEDDEDVPATPTRKSKGATPSSLGPPKLAVNTDRARLSKENLLSSTWSNRRTASSQRKNTGPASSTSEVQSVPSTNGKATSKSTPARSQPPRMATLRYGAPDGMLPVRDDGDALVYACGHKVYKPPRKLNKNVVGYLYE